MNQIPNIFVCALLACVLTACASKKVEQDTRSQVLPEGSKSSITSLGDGGKTKIDSSFNTKFNDIAPAVFIENLSDNEGFLDFCSQYMYSENHYDDIRASRYLTQGDFRRNTDSLIFFANLTDYIESVSFTSPHTGFISLSHAPNSDFAKRTGLSIEGIAGGTDIFRFSLNPNSTDFGYLKGFDQVNSEFWDSHPYASSRVVGNDTITLLIWSSDNKRGKAFTKAVYADGKAVNINDTDLYYIYLVNDETIGKPRKIEGDISVVGSNEGSPFAHCLCEESNWLFFSSNRNNATSDFDIYAAKIVADFDDMTLRVVGSPEKLDSESKDVKNAADSIVYSIPSSINSFNDERFPFVLNSEAGNPVIYFSSDRFGTKTSLDDKSYVKSLGGYDIYSFELDPKFSCVPEPIPPSEIVLEVAFMETNSGNALVDGEIIVEGAERISDNSFSLKQGECYDVKAITETDKYIINDAGSIDYYYYVAKLTTDYTEPISIQTASFRDSLVSTNSYKVNRLLNNIELDTITKFIDKKGFIVKEVTFRTISWDDGFNLFKDKFRIMKTVSDSTVSYGRIIPDSTDDFVLRNESKVSGEEVSSVRSLFTPLCVPESLESKQITIYDTVWVSRRTKPKPENSLIVTLIDKCDSKKSIKSPVLEITDSEGNAYLEESNQITIEIKPDMVYSIRGGSNTTVADCDSYSDLILHGYQSWDQTCDITDYSYINGPEVNSVIGQLDTRGFVSDTIIYDTVYIKSHFSTKPPCEIAFTTLKGINKNVPYFQTAFWEVNTSGNLGDYETAESHLYYLGGEGYDTDHPLARSSSFIELHPRGRYFPLWQGEETAERRKRIREYKEYAQTVDRNLNRIAKTIADERIPQFLRLQSITPESNHKLVIELEAVSDRRPVRNGVYTGKSTISYTESQYDSQSGKLVSEIVSISSGSELGLDNDTLSKLRAWFGYQELIDRLKEYEAFQSMLESGKVLLPDSKMSQSDIESKLENSEIIITTKGNFVDDQSKAKILNYDRENKESSFFVYDSTRKVNIVVRALAYENGMLIQPDCCNPDYNTRRLLSVEDYEKLYMKNEEVK